MSPGASRQKTLLKVPREKTMNETLLSMTVDNVVLSAQVPLGATLAEFLQAAGLSEAQRLLTDGVRALSPELELGHRFAGSTLLTEVPPALLHETPALLLEELLVVAERSYRPGRFNGGS
jgi:hypothetical protein